VPGLTPMEPIHGLHVLPSKNLPLGLHTAELAVLGPRVHTYRSCIWRHQPLRDHECNALPSGTNGHSSTQVACRKVWGVLSGHRQCTQAWLLDVRHSACTRTWQRTQRMQQRPQAWAPCEGGRRGQLPRGPGGGLPPGGACLRGVCGYGTPQGGAGWLLHCWTLMARGPRSLSGHTPRRGGCAQVRFEGSVPPAWLSVHAWRHLPALFHVHIVSQAGVC
jgi:hypothetical protein